MSRKRVPFLETTVAAVAVVAAAVLMALPARRSEESLQPQLLDSLALLRTAVFRYTLDHATPADPDVQPGPEGSFLVEQLTRRTTKNGRTARGDTPRDERSYGPYLKRIPANPVNGLTSIRVMPADVVEPQVEGTAGWVYVPATGRIVPDLPGTDWEGNPYWEY